MESELLFDGVRYVSSSRAAKLVGYTKDYVGQLCRAGKLEARFVGRSWYVSEDGIRRHKLGVHYTRHLPIEQRASTFPDSTVRSTRRDTSDSNKSRDTQDHVERAVKLHRNAEVQQSRNTHTAVAMRRVDEKKNKQYQALSQSDIRYEEGVPLFYEDDRPVLPEPVKVVRFEGTPIVTRSAKPTRHHFVRAEAPATGSIRVRRATPVRPLQAGVSIDGVLLTHDRSTETRRPTKREDAGLHASLRSPEVPTASIRSRPSSKAFPVLGALVVVLLSILAWLIMVAVGIDMPALF